MKKILSLFAAVSLAVSMNAAAPANVESVDLGLPSGLKWATFNVGATAPEGNGDYFAWGETEPYYSSQDPLTWKTGKETGYAWESYCGSSSFDEWSTAPYDATTKNLKPEFDAATANWGSDWHMPTKAELDELKNNCTWTWTADYNGTGIKGCIVTSKAEGNTNSIFLPASGYYNKLSLKNAGSEGDYWSASINEFYSGYASDLSCASSYVGWNSGNRNYGRPVRPVTTKLIVPEPKVDDQFVDTISVLKFEVTAVGDTNTVKVIKNNYSGTSYTVPDTVKYLDVDFAVTEIGKEAFALRSSLESITLPAGLTTIGENAFSECSSLQSITIPASVTTIGVGAFYECTSLESITLPAGLTTIENEVFNNCEKLQSIIIPADVTTIGEIAFAGSGLQTITIPAGVISLGMGAFAECAGLTSVTFLGNACQGAIGELAFYEVGKDAPALLTLPNSWTGSKPDEDGNWYGGKFELSEEPTPQTWGEWEDFAPLGLNTGKYTYATLGAYTQVGIQVQVRKDNTGLKQYTLKNWGKGYYDGVGQDLVLNMNPDYTFTFTSDVVNLGAEIYLQDVATAYNNPAYASYNSYDPETGVFSFYTAVVLASSGSIYTAAEESLVMNKLFTERDTVDIVSTAFSYNDLIASNKVTIYYATDVEGYYLFRVTSNNATSVDGTFKWSDGTINDPNSYFSVSGTDKNYFQDGEFTMVTTDAGTSLTGWMIGVDEKYYRLNWSKKTGVLDYDSDAPFDATFAWSDMDASIKDGVISISATNAEGLTIGLELYADPTATTIPAGVYTISDSQEAGTALKSVGMTGGFLNECFAGIRAASGAFADTWFMVEGTVTLSYDEYGKLKVVVDAKNSYEQPVTALVQYSTTPTALPTLFGDGVKGNKFMRNGQLIIRKAGKTYNAVGF